MKEALVIWLGIILLVVCILVPPYGYTRTVKLTFYTERPSFSSIETNVVPWTYVRHQFILSEPKTYDRRLKGKEDKELNSWDSTSVVDMRIAWHIIAVEAVVIVLVACGAVFTLRVRQKRG